MRPSHWLYTIPLRLRSLFRRDAVEQDLDSELRDHLEQKAAHYRATGLSAQEARRTALRDLGGFELRKEQCRDTRRTRPLEDLAQDVRYSLRAIRKSPGFAATAILTLALGIGANAAIFSVIDTVLLRSLPYPEPDRLLVFTSNQSLPDVEDIQKQATLFTAIGGITNMPLPFTGHGDPVQMTVGTCNVEFFTALGLQPAIGRLFTPEEDRFGGPALVVLTHGTWTRFFGADPSVLGRSIRLGGNSYTVIGVLRPDFWIPGKQLDAIASLRIVYPLAAKFRGVHFLNTYARLKPGVSIEQTADELKSIDAWLAGHYPENDRDFHRHLKTVREAVVGDVRLELLVLFAAVAVVLLIACVNFASLQLARSAARRREIAIRSALGAPISRLVRQIVTESVLLSLFGAAFGVILAVLGVRLLLLLKPGDLPRIENVAVDSSVLAFTFLLSLITGIFFGLIPAFSSAYSRSIAHLKEDARASSGGASGFRLRRLLVISEIALALVLLITATLMLRSFVLLNRVEPGFRADNLLTLRIDLPESQYRSFEKQRQFHQEFLERLNGSSGVRAAFVSELPMSGDWLTHNTVIDGRPRPLPGSEPEIQTRTVAGDYFRIMGIPLLAGRDFSSQDHTGTQHVAVVNRAFVEQYFPNQSPLGARVDWARSDPPNWMTIIGVVGDVKHFGPADPEQPAIYDLYSQTPNEWKRWMYVVLRSDAPTPALLSLARQQLAAVDDQLPVTHVSTMSEVVAASLDHQRFSLTLLGTFAAVALALAFVGIYGVISYSVTQRTSELGIRVAMGAQRRDILGLILGQGARLALVGAIIGVLGAFVLTRYLAHLLFTISPRDPVTFSLIPVALCAVALFASYIPARRAVHADPIRALRHE